MKVICDRAALLDGINLVSGAVAARTPRVQLQCVKLEATKKGSAGELTLLATDGELSMRLKLMQVDVQQTGEALIPADKLRQIVGAEDSEPTLTLETEDDAMHIRGRDAHFKVYGYPAADFPPIPDMTVVVAGSAEVAKAKAVFTHSAAGEGATEHWGQMLPGETAELCLCDADPADTVVTIAWFRPDDGKEYVWRFVV